jgi:uncharacterized protein with FMN-binding domain
MRIARREKGTSDRMKKYLLSLVVSLSSIAYVFQQYSVRGSAGIPPAPPVAVQQSSETVAPTPVPAPVAASSEPPLPASAPKPTPTPAPAPAPAPAPVPAPKPQGQYADGTYTGNVVDAYYGLVQIQVVVQNGTIASVQFLQYPSDRRTSQYINSQAMPILQHEAIQAQSANVNIVSGATDTSLAFRQSLANALAQAKP